LHDFKLAIISTIFQSSLRCVRLGFISNDTDRMIFHILNNAFTREYAIVWVLFGLWFIV